MTDPERPDARRRTGPVVLAAAASTVWLLGAIVLLWAGGSDGALWLAVAVAVALPVVAIWFAALLSRHSADLREEALRLHEAADALRSAAELARARRKEAEPAEQPMRLTPEPRPMRLESQPRPAARPASAAPAASSQSAEPQQESLPLSVEANEAQVSIPDLVRALDFPESAEDEAGFRALRRALRDPKARRLVQASQDMLTLLSEEGVYMDDLAPDRARPDTWRRFAAGDRGPAVARVGGIRDRSSLALSAARMRADPVFRDVAHHFLRLFDQSLAEIAPHASDAELAELADTRTARAFMLVGRVAGMFE